MQNSNSRMLRWVRATHTEGLAGYPAWSRPFHLEMPLLREDMSALLSYPTASELAFCIPISWAARRDTERYRFEGYVKNALFLVRQLVHFWDLREQGVPVFLGISENGLDCFWEYATLCNFPSEHVVELPSYADTKFGWQIKFDMLDSAKMCEFTRRLHIDASYWLQGRGMRSRCAKLHDRWTQDWFHLRDVIRVPPDFKSYDSPVVTEARRVGDSFYHQLAAVLGTDGDDERQYWEHEVSEYFGASIFGVTTQAWLDSRLQELIMPLRALMHMDEPILSVLARELPIDKTNTLLDGNRGMRDMKYMPGFKIQRAETIMSILSEWREWLGYDIGSMDGASLYRSSVPDER